MARINIEDSLFKDNRFIKLMVKLGSKREALGAVMEAFMLAQKHYLTTDNDRLIPLEDWNNQDICDELIKTGLAEKRDKGIYVFGSEEQFKWLLQRQEAGKRPKSRRKTKKKTAANGTQRDLTEPNGRQRVETSFSNSFSFSNSNSNSNSDFKKKGVVSSGKKPDLPWLAELWNSSCPDLPKVKSCGKARLGKIKSATKEYPDEETWVQVLKSLNSSNFCTGGNDRGWVATFDWILKGETVDKVLDGKYENRKQESKADMRSSRAKGQIQQIIRGEI